MAFDFHKLWTDGYFVNGKIWMGKGILDEGAYDGFAEWENGFDRTGTGFLGREGVQVDFSSALYIES